MATRTSNETKPTRVVRRKSLSLAWTQRRLKVHVSRYRLRWCSSVLEKHRQSESLLKPSANKSVSNTNNSTAESIESAQCIGNVLATEDVTSYVTKDECVGDPVELAACTSAKEKVDSHLTKDYCITEPLTSDECMSNSAGMIEEIDSDVTDCESIIAPVTAAQCVNDTEVAVDKIDLNLTEHTNISEEQVQALTSSTSVAEPGAILSVPSISPPSSSTDYLKVSLTDVYSLTRRFCYRLHHSVCLFVH